MVVEGCREPEREGVGVAPDAGRLRHRAEEARGRRGLGRSSSAEAARLKLKAAARLKPRPKQLGLQPKLQLAAARNVPHDPSQPLMKTPVAKSPAGRSHISASGAAGPGCPRLSAARPRARFVQQPLHACARLGQPLEGSDVVIKEVIERGMLRLHTQQRQTPLAVRRARTSRSTRTSVTQQ